ncbi:hypothetical protein N7478_008423 [Penicillium angulare]|uniref:uncharacterized protein n=1 Tax=Penicillium angulare TaxID=116970 RepID=UPI002540BB57|nr:uncharacterized protein N7478_008423 [Penicillium angulare]KAJ5273298.1 hypothetical protein N7478_008423 [Penicillium angulare]
MFGLTTAAAAKYITLAPKQTDPDHIPGLLDISVKEYADWHQLWVSSETLRESIQNARDMASVPGFRAVEEWEDACDYRLSKRRRWGAGSGSCEVADVLGHRPSFCCADGDVSAPGESAVEVDPKPTQGRLLPLFLGGGDWVYSECLVHHYWGLTGGP